MPTRWPSYVLLLLTALLGWVLPYGLPRLWQVFTRAKSHRPAPLSDAAELNTEAEPISVRFHLAALLFLGFLGFGFLAIPLLFSTRSEEGGLTSILLIGTLLPMVIVLFYCLRKGDLSWNISRSREDSSRSEDEK
jgi:NADH:ubiquinone oxidoreductase subunit 3 (subunit A)